MSYEFTKKWFNNSGIKKEIQKHIPSENINKILEIGSFEGQSSVFFADKLLENDKSFLVCIDPFFDSGTVDGITTLFVDQDVKNRFLTNISKSKNCNKITHHCITSDDFFMKIRHNSIYTFNFIYIDGCHNPEYVQRDVNNAFKILEKNGILWMDDYLYGKREVHTGTPKDVIDHFLEENKGKYEIIYKKYQIAIRKLC